MTISSETWARIYLISDQVLYPEALEFINRHGTIEGQKQLAGLLDYAHNWDDLKRFVDNQRKRDWFGAKEHYKRFYQELDTYLRELQGRVKTTFNFVPEGLPRAKERAQTELYAQALAQEFIQHLAAENLWREKVL
jgi:hypothetical protein